MNPRYPLNPWLDLWLRRSRSG